MSRLILIYSYDDILSLMTLKWFVEDENIDKVEKSYLNGQLYDIRVYCFYINIDLYGLIFIYLYFQRIRIIQQKSRPYL
jgi:hypothetical protein